MKRIVIVLAFSLGVTLGDTVFAHQLQLPASPNLETLDQPISRLLPQPIQDIFGMGGKISESLRNIPFFTDLTDRIKEGDYRPNVLSDFQEFWDKVNAWFEQTLGVSPREVIRVIGNFIIWILDFVIRLIKQGLGYVTTF
jgi:hypothetical protein